MWNISKTDNRRARRTKIWYSGGLFMPNSRGLLKIPDSWVWFGVIQCTFTIFKTPLFSQFSSDSSKLYTMYHNHTGCHFFGRSAKNCKNYGILKYFISRTIFCSNFQSAISPIIFILSPSKLYDIIGYHGKSKCVLEYKKLASGT